MQYVKYSFYFHFSRCCLWIINSGRDDFIELDDKKLKNRTLCAAHIQDNAFVNSTKQRLLPNHPHAVPMRWFESDFGTEPPCIPTSGNHSSTSGNDALNAEANVINKENVSINQATPVINFNLQPITEPAEENLPQFNNSFKSLSDTPRLFKKNNIESTAPIKKYYKENVSINHPTPMIYSNVELITEPAEENLLQFNADFKPLSDTPRLDKKNSIESPTPRKKKLISTITRQRVALKRTRSKIYFLGRNKTKKIGKHRSTLRITPKLHYR